MNFRKELGTCRWSGERFFMILEGCYFERMNSPGLQCGVICHVLCLILCTVFARKMSMALFTFNEIVQFVPEDDDKDRGFVFPLMLCGQSILGPLCKMTLREY